MNDPWLGHEEELRRRTNQNIEEWLAEHPAAKGKDIYHDMLHATARSVLPGGAPRPIVFKFYCPECGVRS